MTRDEFFKQVLKQCFLELVKEPTTITWDNDYNVYTITMKKKSFDWYIKIYEEHVLLLSSNGKGPYRMDEFDVDVLKVKLKGISDEIPF